MTYRTLRTAALCALPILGTAVLLAGCAAGSSPSVDEPEVRLVMVQGGSSIPYQQEEAAGAKAGAEAAGVSLSFAGPSLPDASAQVNALQQVVSTNPDGILIQELPPDQFTRPVQLAEEAGIVVLPYQVPPAADSTSKSFVGNNDRDLGRAAGAAVADAIIAEQGADATGEILTGICIPGLSVLENRVAGFTEAVEAALPNVTVKEPVTTALESAGSYNVWKPAIDADPGILSAYSPCEPDTQALTKIRQESAATWKLVGHDIDSITLAGVQSGDILGLYPISSYQHGYLAAYILGTALKNGETIPEGWIPEDTLVIDSGNIETVGADLGDPDKVAEFWQPYIDAILDKPDYGARPLADASL